ncbi:MAG: leucine-rich repeat protein [Oscillospiraceae bacterium]|nr:leucine-rich repeat protein [Oscillospiraceae bacterium]
MSQDFGFEPYEGKEPFIFICYKTEDKAVVSEIARILKDKGVRVWYDRGIKQGQLWRAVISEHICYCSAMLAFTSPNFYKLKSNHDSETLLELAMAKDDYRKPILRIEIEQEKLTAHPPFVPYLSNSRQFLQWNGNDDCLTGIIEIFDIMNCVETSNDSLTVEEPVSEQPIFEQSVSAQPSKPTNLEDLKDFKCKKTADGKGWRLVKYTGNEENVTVPDVITEIGYETFRYCKFLTKIAIPNSVTSIDNRAFYYCESLTQINIPDSVTSIGEGTFFGCSSLTQITIPNSVTSIGGSAFESCSFLTQIIIPNSVTSIGYSAFRHCKSLKQIIIPNSVTSIGTQTFSHCTDLTQITIPNSVISIGNWAFGGCTSLMQVTIPNSVTSIDGRAFKECSSLTQITIPNSVTSIGGEAFYNCHNLTIYTTRRSYAEQYAKAHGINYRLI